jgi:formate dehydrogenase major subunit
MTITFELNGKPVTAQPGETLWQVAHRCGTAIPHLCHTGGLAPAGNCRACMVEVLGERTLAASCCRMSSAGMQVHSTSPRARAAQKMVLELLQSDMPQQPLKHGDELQLWAGTLGLAASRRARARWQMPATRLSR